MNIVKDLILHPFQRLVAEVKLGRTKYGNTENGFLECVDENDFEVFKLFLAADVNINVTDGIGETALIKVARKEQMSLLSMLLEQEELLVDKQALGGDTALIVACRAGKRDAVLLLLGHPRLTPSIKNDAGQTALMIACQHDATIVALLLAHPAITLNDQDRNGETALMHASKAGNVEAVQLLLRKEGLKLNLCNEQEHSALYLSISGGNQAIETLLKQAGADHKAVAKKFLYEMGISFDPVSFFSEIRNQNIRSATLFLQAGMSTDEKEPDGTTPLLLAAETDWIPGAQLLINEGAGVNSHRNDGINPFISAVRLGSLEMVSLLLEHPKLALNDKTCSDETALSIACRSANPDVLMTILRDRRLDVNARDPDGDTALLACCRSRRAGLVEALLQRPDTDVNELDKYGNTPLILAAAQGDLEIGKLLLTLRQGKIKVDQPNEDGNCALYESIVKHRYEFRDLLLKYGADKSIAARKILQDMGIDLQMDPFFEAIRLWNEERVTLFLDAGISQDTKDLAGNPALILAAEMHWLRLAQILVEHGADINIRNPHGASALMVAAGNGYQDLVDWLKEHGADEAGLHETMLFRAIELGSIQEIEENLAQNPLLNVRNHQGEFPLSVAVRLNRPDVVAVLLEKGKPPINDRDADGKTVLMKACEKNLIDLIDSLIDHGANVNERSSLDGKTALILAAERGLVAMVQKLLGHGADTNIEDSHGWTALTAAILRDHRYLQEKLRPLTREDILSTLIHATRRGDLPSLTTALGKADLPNTLDDEGNSLLAIASQRGWTDIVTELLQRKTAMDIKNKAGDSALILAARAGHLEVVKQLFDEKLPLPRPQSDGRNLRRNTALIEAARHGRSAIVLFLLEKGADAGIAGEDKTTALLEAGHLGMYDAVQALVSSKGQDDPGHLKSFLDSQSKYGYTPLMSAILAGHTQIARFLKESGAEKGEEEASLFFAARSGNVQGIEALQGKVKVNVFNKAGSTPLLDAVERGHVAAMSALLLMDANITGSSQGRSALSLAAVMGRIDMLEILRPHVGDDEFLPTVALLAAARQGQVKAVHFLLKETRVKIDGIVPRTGRRSESEGNMRDLGVPLVSAAANGHYDVVSVLLANRADVNRKDLHGQTALASAILNGHERIAQLLREHGADEATAYTASLIEAARKGDLKKIEELLQFDPDLNVGDREGRTALIWAAARGKDAAVKRLLEYRSEVIDREAKIENQSLSKRTALMESCRGGYIKVVQYLLGSVAQDEAKRAQIVDAEDIYHNTPLKEALVNEHKTIAQLLEAHGATKGRNEAELLDAAKYGRTDAIARLLQTNVDIDTTNQTGKTPLMIAAENGNIATAKMLKEARANVDLKSRTSGETALILAAKNGYKEIVRVLLSGPASVDVNESPHNGRTALIEAAQAGYVEITKDLIASGAAVSSISKNGETALIVAVQGGHQNIVGPLLEAGADIDVVTGKGWTALMEAANGNHVQILKSLLKRGADVNMVDQTGTTALMLAVHRGFVEIVDALAGVEWINFDKVDRWGRTALTLAHLGGALAGLGAARLFTKWTGSFAQLLKNAAPIELSLLKHGARKGWNEAEFILAAYARNAAYIRELVKENVDLNTTDLQHARTAIAIACILGDRETAQVLIQVGADLNRQSDDGRTPLIHAIRHAHSKLAVQLLETDRINVATRDESGDAAVIEAARGGYIEVLRALTAHGARLDVSNTYGRTALMEAASNGRLEILQALLARDRREHSQPPAFASAVDENGRTALDLALSAGHVECAKFLQGKKVPTSADVGLVVYVTPHGRCYHRRDCKAITEARNKDELTPIKFVDLGMPAAGEDYQKKYDSCGICEPESSRQEIQIAPRKILFLAANPSDTARLKLDEESRAIDLSIRKSEYRDYFDIKQHWSVRRNEIQECLLRHRPEIVHFSGHGWPTGEIVFVDEEGKSAPASSDTLGTLFQLLQENIQCVILNACYTEKLAIKIVEHVDFVVGLPTTVRDETAIGFAGAFYQALGYGQSYQKAFELGCNQVEMDSGGSQLGTPRLFQRNDLHVFAA